MIIFSSLNIAGMLIGSLIAEYLLQPDFLCATKKDWTGNKRYAFLAGIIHSMVWTMLVTILASIGWQYTMQEIITLPILLFTLHYLLDCTPLSSWIAAQIHVEHVDRNIGRITQRWGDWVALSMEKNSNPSHDEIVQIATDSMELAGNIAGMKFYELGLHAFIVLLVWMFV